MTTATAAEFNREPAKILGQVEGGETVCIERNGTDVAIIYPVPKSTSGAELARRLRGMKPAPEATKELEQILQQMDDASRRSHPH
jgi:antitoxin (DNA-binding transcriptional repressor) of toxin-antitoxin stability system